MKYRILVMSLEGNWGVLFKNKQTNKQKGQNGTKLSKTAISVFETWPSRQNTEKHHLFKNCQSFRSEQQVSVFLPGAALPSSPALCQSCRFPAWVWSQKSSRLDSRERTARIGAKCTHSVEKERGSLQLFEVPVNLENDSWTNRLRLSCQKLRYPKKACVPFSLFKS